MVADNSLISLFFVNNTDVLQMILALRINIYHIFSHTQLNRPY